MPASYPEDRPEDERASTASPARIGAPGAIGVEPCSPPKTGASGPHGAANTGPWKENPQALHI